MLTGKSINVKKLKGFYLAFAQAHISKQKAGYNQGGPRTFDVLLLYPMLNSTSSWKCWNNQTKKTVIFHITISSHILIV
jgi:hypothetical protein